MLIDEPDQAEFAISTLRTCSPVAVDTETYFVDLPEDRKLIGVSAYGKLPTGQPISYYFPFRHQAEDLFSKIDANLPLDWLPALVEALQEKSQTLLFHNAKFDLQVFWRDGLDLSNYFIDTMLLSYMLNENSTHALKKLADIYLEADASSYEQYLKKLHKQLGAWHKIPAQVMGKYAEKDVELTYRLYELFWPLMEKQSLSELWPTEAEFARLLAEIEFYGVQVDTKKAKQLDDACQARLEEIQGELGFEPLKQNQLAQRLFLPEPEGLGFRPGPLSRKTSKAFPDGVPETKEQVLEPLSEHPVVTAVLEYRSLNKAASTYFRPFYELADTDGRIHPEYQQHGTVTTRLSCKNPNMQNLPRRSDDPEAVEMKQRVRGLLQAPQGWELWSFDYSQLEYRLATCYGQDQHVLDAYREGSDFHDLTSQQLGLDRYAAKTLNFAIIYGAGARKLAEMLSLEEREARDILDRFWDSYPGLRSAIKKATETANRRTWIRLWTGRRRHFAYSSEHHKAFNSVIQGGGAELVKLSMLKLKAFNFKLVGQVHDEVWLEVPEGANLDKVKEIMEWPGKEFPIEFPVEGKQLA
jgi:DNA polymerase-1